MNKIILVSGFLGVGKTTLIKDIIKKYNNEKIVIIENDFGKENIDASLLKSYKLKVNEINSGCICCSLISDFETAIKDIRKDFDPDILIIEPSGIADTSIIINYLLKIKYVNINSIVIIDSNNHLMYLDNFLNFYENQILSANSILLTRSNNLKVIESIKKINKNTKIFIDNDFDINELIDDSNIFIPFKDFLESDDMFKNYSSMSLLMPRKYNFNRINNQFMKIIENKDIKRIKGIINIDGEYNLVNYYYGEDIKYEILKDYSSIGKIVIIGENLEEKRINDILGRKLLIN